MNREEMLSRIGERGSLEWDVLVIGGGATGLGAALDASARGYGTVLVEAADFAKGTSSRSTKIIHGGVRYLRQGNLRLVRDSLRERGLLLRNCPELVTDRGFVVPHYHRSDRLVYGAGLRVYDLLAGELGLQRSRHLSKEGILREFPTLASANLRGGTLYFDGQFDDARLAVALAQAAVDAGGVLVNHMAVEGLIKERGRVKGVSVRDGESGGAFELRSRVVINATGVFVDAIRHMDDGTSGALVTPSQGIHIVLDRSFLPSSHALMIPKTDDGRLLFAIPWHGRVLTGTTDTPRQAPELEPRPLAAEIDYLLSHLARYLTRAPTRGDVRSAFAGLRPLVKPSGPVGATSRISRDHTIAISPGGLVTITGGKWTTFRHMAEDVIDRAAAFAGLASSPCQTKTLRIPGSILPPVPGANMDADADADAGALVHPGLEIREGHVRGAVVHEMARTVEDVLARRTRMLFLDAKASIEAAPAVARLLARELGRDGAWIANQIGAFEETAQAYLLRS